MDFHERVARAMKASHAAGTLNSYEEILHRLRTKFPTEERLRVYCSAVQKRAEELYGLGKAEFPADECECQHCSALVLTTDAKGITCKRCGATTAPRP